VGNNDGGDDLSLLIMFHWQERERKSIFVLYCETLSTNHTNHAQFLWEGIIHYLVFLNKRRIAAGWWDGERGSFVLINVSQINSSLLSIMENDTCKMSILRFSYRISITKIIVFVHFCGISKLCVEREYLLQHCCRHIQQK
jgi:hypothetical protein